MTRKQEHWASPDGLTLLSAWAREGLGEEEIARRMGVRPSHLRAWRRRCPQIAGALAGTREVVDARVEQALLQRALGYEYTERVDETGQTPGANKSRELFKHEPPNVMAIKLWLACRRPEAWGGRAGAGEALSRLDALLGGMDEQARRGEGEGPCA